MTSSSTIAYCLALHSPVLPHVNLELAIELIITIIITAIINITAHIYIIQGFMSAAVGYRSTVRPL